MKILGFESYCSSLVFRANTLLLTEVSKLGVRNQSALSQILWSL